MLEIISFIAVEGSDLTVGIRASKFTIEAFKNGDAGIKLISANNKAAEVSRYGSPLVLDLDGDGLDLVSLSDSGAYFDIDNDGFAERMGWVGSDDGFLALDINGDGIINNVSELFGAGVTKPSISIHVKKNKYGLAALAKLDDNSDGVIDHLDAKYDELVVWRDFNGEGRSSSDELISLTNAGVVSIDLKPTLIRIKQAGHLIVETSTFTRTDGTIGKISDVWFEYDPFDTIELDVPEIIDDDVERLPYIMGRGEVSNLDNAMQRDPVLKEMMIELSNLTVAESAGYIQKVEAIILRWHQVEDVKADSRGSFVNGQHLAAIEKLQGFKFRQLGVEPNPRSQAGAVMMKNWKNYTARIAVELLTQIPLGEKLAFGVENIMAITVELKDGATFSDALITAASFTPQNKAEAAKFWYGLSVLYGDIAATLRIPSKVFIAQFNLLASNANIGFSYADFKRMITGSDKGDIIIGSSSRQDFMLSDGIDILFGGKGDDILYGGAGADIYVFGRGMGNDIIDDTRYENIYNYRDEGSTIQFLDIYSKDEININLEEHLGGYNIVIKIINTGETLTLKGQFEDYQYLPDVKRFIFADGSQLGWFDFLPNYRFYMVRLLKRYGVPLKFLLHKLIFGKLTLIVVFFMLILNV